LKNAVHKQGAQGIDNLPVNGNRRA